MCCGSITRTALLANSARFLLTLADNKIGTLLRLRDNEPTLFANSLQISLSAQVN